MHPRQPRSSSRPRTARAPARTAAPASAGWSRSPSSCWGCPSTPSAPSTSPPAATFVQALLLLRAGLRPGAERRTSGSASRVPRGARPGRAPTSPSSAAGSAGSRCCARRSSSGAVASSPTTSSSPTAPSSLPDWPDVHFFISVDGTREAHEAVRGAGTYDKIRGNADRPDLDVMVTCCVNRQNVASIEEFMMEWDATCVRHVAFEFHTPIAGLARTTKRWPCRQSSATRSSTGCWRSRRSTATSSCRLRGPIG